MKRETLYGRDKADIFEFKTINEFYNYISETEYNYVFKDANKQSMSGTYSFTRTHDFKEATELLQNGWNSMSAKLVQKLNVIKNQIQPNTKQKTIYDVVGYQPSVSRYLQGIPTNMMSKKNVPIKQKIITLNKAISYSWSVGTDVIIEQSTKALQIVKKLEAQGYRVNLNVIMGVTSEQEVYCKVRIKNANERLNLSKLAYPLVHPSMFRRLFFRFMEVNPATTLGFRRAYGFPIESENIRRVVGKEYLLPPFINKDISQINNIEDLENL
jgi:hypothetical protein